MKRVLLLAMVVAVVVTSLASEASAKKVTHTIRVFCDIGTLNDCRNMVDPATTTLNYECTGDVHGTITCQVPNRPDLKPVAVSFRGESTDTEANITADEYAYTVVLGPKKPKRCKNAHWRHLHPGKCNRK